MHRNQLSFYLSASHSLFIDRINTWSIFFNMQNIEYTHTHTRIHARYNICRSRIFCNINTSHDQQSDEMAINLLEDDDEKNNINNKISPINVRLTVWNRLVYLSSNGSISIWLTSQNKRKWIKMPRVEIESGFVCSLSYCPLG